MFSHCKVNVTHGHLQCITYLSMRNELSRLSVPNSLFLDEFYHVVKWKWKNWRSSDISYTHRLFSRVHLCFSERSVKTRPVGFSPSGPFYAFEEHWKSECFPHVPIPSVLASMCSLCNLRELQHLKPYLFSHTHGLPIAQCEAFWCPLWKLRKHCFFIFFTDTLMICCPRSI